MNIFLAGCAGYLGSVTTQYLLRAGHSVVGLDSFRYNNHCSVLHLLGDPHFRLLDKPLAVYLAECPEWDYDVVINMAALVGPICEQHPTEASLTNAHLISIWTEQLWPETKFVQLTTNSGYGSTDGTSECTEEDPLRPLTHYGRTKVLGEELALQHPSSVSLRLATAFGVSPRMRFDLLVNDFTAKLTRDHQLLLYEPNYWRNYVHVKDVARAIDWAIQKDLKGIFNVGNPDLNCSKIQLAHTICDILKLSRDSVKVGTGKDPDQRNYQVSNRKILGTGFQFQHGLDMVEEIAWLAQRCTAEEFCGMRNQ